MCIRDSSVTDPDGDTVNVVEKIDGKTIATKNAITLGATQTLSVAGNTFTALTNAKHTITITATDSAGNSAVRTLTFTKSIAGFVITLSAPLEANSQPTRANVKVTRDIPAGGTFKVEVTNNPFDASPVWEDCTNAVIQGVAHVFTNKINTAVQHGMNIRVTVQRGDALTACWVSGIGVEHVIPGKTEDRGMSQQDESSSVTEEELQALLQELLTV